MRPFGGLLPIAAVGVAATCLVATPLLATVWIGLQEGVPGSGLYSLAAYEHVLTDEFGRRALWNAVILGITATFLTMLLALPLAWLVARTDLPFKRLVILMTALVLVIPGFIQGMGWILVLSPRIGIANQLIALVTGSDTPFFDIYTLPGIIFVQTLNLVPPAFFMLVSVLAAMDASFEEAAYLSGVSKLRTLIRINLPLALPAIAAATIYVLVLAVSLFEIPAVLGIPNRVFVFSTMIYVLTNTGSGVPDYALAAAYGSLLMVFSVLLAMQYSRLLRNSRRFATVGGKGLRARVLRLGRWRWIAAGGVALYILLAVGLPFAMLVWVSLTPFFQAPSIEAVSTLTLRNYANVLDQRRLEPFLNTAVVIVLVPIAALLMSVPISWLVVRSKITGRSVMDAVAFLPHAVPRVVLAVSFLYLGLVLRPVVPLYGTIGLIVVAQVIMYVGFATRSLNGALTQLHPELEEAARINGASAVRTLFKVTLPLVKSTIFFSWLWVMLLAFREATVSLMLTSVDNLVLPVVIWNRWNDGKLNEAGAAAVVLTVLATALLVLARRGLRGMTAVGMA